ncbi:hypothetical protein [uncultured Mycobacterium sp.]|uniref:hypothetical protein n=1 Tax=uncultured Mycobacterium sp. TaxID=171292 RepID=UPI0035CC0066
MKVVAALPRSRSRRESITGKVLQRFCFNASLTDGQRRWLELFVVRRWSAVLTSRL